jgi:hypothetical protein
MGAETRRQASARRDMLIILALWLLVSALMIWRALPSIGERTFPDPDDAMRLLQVRDWLAGQSWFDVTQYRLNPPAGGPMHWSRIVDLPIAAVILLVKPFAGQYGAETAALVLIPLLTLAITMLLVFFISCRLMERPGPMLAVIATPMTLGAQKQMRIMRIDHHGWQIVLALVALLGVLDPRPRRGGIMAGVAMAVWLNISIEGLPFTAAVGAWFAFEWLRDAAAAQRLKSYLAALTVATVAVFGLTHAPSTWQTYPHDALTPAHFSAFATAWLCCHLGMRSDFANVWKRLAVLAGAGALTVAATFTVDPHFLQAPFAALDPIVRDLWYNAVDEGQPVWKLQLSTAAQALAQPLVGLAGALFAIRMAPAKQRDSWLAFAWLLFAGTIMSCCVVREATTVSVLSVPGTAFLCTCALRRARTVSLMPLRAVATAGALCIMTPAYAVPATLTPSNPRLSRATAASDACVTRTEIEKLNQLPPSNLAVPMDITPPILVMTPHTAIASGYHRNVSGIRDTILLFVSKPDQAREIVARRHIDYLVFCPQTPETVWWSENGPHGLAAMLNENKAPDWLEPAGIRGLHALKVWRVRLHPASAPST